MFDLEFSKQAKKFLKSSDVKLVSRILKKVGLLTLDPVPHGSVRVVGEDKTFRLRVGDYRVFYEVNWNEKVILIVKIDKRSKVY